MTCLFDCEAPIDWDFDYIRLYESCVDAALTAEGCPYEACVSLLVTDDEGIRQINNDMRSIDAVTDVLSFPMLDYTAPSDFAAADSVTGAFEPETGELLLGDIVISAEMVEKQALQYGHDIQREYAFLIIHSMLHLCGYDHMDDGDRILMEERQKIIIESMYNDFPMLRVR